MTSIQKISIAAAGTALIAGGALAWFFFFKTDFSQRAVQNNFFETGGNITTDAPGEKLPNAGSASTSSAQSFSNKKIFKIANGPVAGATFIQTRNPTTTITRFVSAENGHVADLTLETGEAAPRAISNTTIPGVIKVGWGEAGGAAILNYIDGVKVKTAYLGFPLATTSGPIVNKAVRLQFLPDGILDSAISPDGKSIAYLLKTASGADGYTAKIDGGGVTKLFSLPLSQLLISWPSQNMLLIGTRSGAGIPGIVFSVDTRAGGATPILYAPGLTAIGNRNFSHIVYQTVDGTERSTYVRDIGKEINTGLSFDPIPEKCAWEKGTTPVILYCAVPLRYLEPDYLDLWHQGRTSASDSIIAFNVSTGKSTVLATPGSAEGGVESDILELAISPDNQYLLFIQKGDRALWGVRLGTSF